jgi:hypothetical protein
MTLLTHSLFRLENIINIAIITINFPVNSNLSKGPIVSRQKATMKAGSLNICPPRRRKSKREERDRRGRREKERKTMERGKTARE